VAVAQETGYPRIAQTSGYLKSGGGGLQVCMKQSDSFAFALPVEERGFSPR